MNEHLLRSLDEISDRHLMEASAPRRRRSRILIRAAAAVLAVILLLSLSRPEPESVLATELVSPAAFDPLDWPMESDFSSEEAYQEALKAYHAQDAALSSAAREAMANMEDFWRDSFRLFLDGDENTVWSPVNTYLSLAVMAQVSSGGTRQEILNALGVDGIETLQQNAKAVWERVWADNGQTQRRLANSIWLDGSLHYKGENLQVLGECYYTSVHTTNHRTSQGAADIRAWIESQTQGILDSASPINADNGTSRMLAFASTSYINETWLENFDPDRNRTGVFHAPSGDVDCTYMNANMDTTKYARGENYDAVALSTNGGCRLWLILPDQGTSVSKLLKQGDYMETVLDRKPDSRKVILTMPKFDITATVQLEKGLKKLGVDKIFSFLGSDFSGIVDMKPVKMDEINQTSRIIVDETGIRAGSGEVWDLIAKSSEKPITITLDRPFLFVLMLDTIPLYAGVVAQP